MNNLVFNRTAERLKTAIYGSYNNTAVPVAADENGRLLFAPESEMTVTATNLDIRNLTSARDTVNVTATDLDIRPLTAEEDSVEIGARAFTLSSTTLTVPASTETYLLTQNIGFYSQNSYFIRNTNGAGSITVALEIAPADTDAYYVSSTDQALGAGNNLVTSIATLMQYARLRVQTGGIAIGVVAYYNGRA